MKTEYKCHGLYIDVFIYFVLLVFTRGEKAKNCKWTKYTLHLWEWMNEYCITVCSSIQNNWQNNIWFKIGQLINQWNYSHSFLIGRRITWSVFCSRTIQENKIKLKSSINDIVDRCSLNCISEFFFLCVCVRDFLEWRLPRTLFITCFIVSHIPLCPSPVILFIVQHFAIQASFDVTWNQFLWCTILWR